MKVVLDVDGEEVVIDTQDGNTPTVIIPKGDMNVVVKEGQNYVQIGPEETVACANDLEQDQWELIRANKKFLSLWNSCWESTAPPVVLRKASLGLRHVAGLILMCIRAKALGQNIHIMFPETYLHPAEQRMLMTMIDKLSKGGL